MKKIMIASTIHEHIKNIPLRTLELFLRCVSLSISSLLAMGGCSACTLTASSWSSSSDDE